MQRLRNPTVEPKFPGPSISSDIGVSFRVAKYDHPDSDLDSVVSLINRESKKSGALLKVDKQQVGRWMVHRNSFIAVDNGTAQVVAHMAVVQWPGCFEVRSIVVREDHRGKGIYGIMSDAIIEAIFAVNPETLVVEIKNGNSNGRGLLEQQGFKVTGISGVLALGVQLQEAQQTPDRAAYLLIAESYKKLEPLKGGLRGI